MAPPCNLGFPSSAATQHCCREHQWGQLGTNPAFWVHQGSTFIDLDKPRQGKVWSSALQLISTWIIDVELSFTFPGHSGVRGHLGTVPQVPPGLCTQHWSPCTSYLLSQSGFTPRFRSLFRDYTQAYKAMPHFQQHNPEDTEPCQMTGPAPASP